MLSYMQMVALVGPWQIPDITGAELSFQLLSLEMASPLHSFFLPAIFPKEMSAKGLLEKAMS